MFPQPDLKVAPQKGGTVDVIGGEDVQAKAVGEDTINVSWRGKLKIAVPVKVAANAVTDLQIDPHPKERSTPARRSLTRFRHARRQPRDPHSRRWRAVECHRSRRSRAWLPARPFKRTGPGQTKVVADFGGQKAEAVLNVTPGVAGGPVASGDRRHHGRSSIYGGRRRRVVIGGGTVVGDIKPAGKVVALVFDPPFYRAGVQALPQTAKLLRQYENGGFDDVSNDPNVKVTDPNADIAKIEKVDGGWKVSPVAPGHDQDDRHAGRPDRHHADRIQRRCRCRRRHRRATRRRAQHALALVGRDANRSAMP